MTKADVFMKMDIEHILAYGYKVPRRAYCRADLPERGSTMFQSAVRLLPSSAKLGKTIRSETAGG